MRTATLVITSLFVACAGPKPEPAGLKSWGTLREVMRDGNSAGRIAVAQAAAAPSAFGVGALAGLGGEVTVVDGQALVAVAGAGPDGAPTFRKADPGDSAALLVVAEVPEWDQIPIGSSTSYAQLEERVAEELTARGIDRSTPLPIRVRGRAVSLSMHVLSGACPYADPDGPAPWRFEGACDDIELVGIYVEGGTGTWTHHGRLSHLHAVGDGRTGHLDEIVIEDATLMLPSRR